MNRLLVCLLVFPALFTSVVTAQNPTDLGLVAHYPFDASLQDATGTTANAGLGLGMLGYTCGIAGQALSLDGSSAHIIISGPVRDEFDTEDFTISFYMKSTGSDGTQYILSKRDSSCTNERVFYIRYVPTARTLNCVLSENGSKAVNISHILPPDRCWFHIVLQRQGNRVRLYVDMEQVAEQGTVSRIDLDNEGDLYIGNGLCRGPVETLYEGLIDDLRIYNRALDVEQLATLFFEPDRIATPNTQIFLGESVDIELTTTCGTMFDWSPPADVFNADDPEPRITPSQKGNQIFNIEIRDAISTCVARDSIRLTVIDPDDLDCNEIFMPSGFTPNGNGPVENETFGIANPFAVQNLISFEIFDRWGGRVFFTDDPFQRWDGFVQGKAVNSNVFLYKIVYECEGEEKALVGSVAIIR